MRVALLLGLLVAVVGELALRRIPELKPVTEQLRMQQRAGDRAYIFDPELGNRVEPSQRTLNHSLDFDYWMETDAAGFPNGEPWPDPVDVVVLGNSLVVGPGVGLRGQFSTLLGEMLGGARVLNLGLPGGSPEQQLLLWRRYAAARQPSLVLASLWVASDVENALHFEHWQRESPPEDYLTFRTTFGDRGEPPNGLRALLVRSHLARWVRYGVPELLRRGRYAERVKLPSGEKVLLSVATQKRLAQGLERPVEPRLRSVFFDPLVRLQDEVRRSGAAFAVVVIPSKEELYGAELFPGVLRAVREVRAGLDSLALPVVDLYEPLGSRAAAESPFFPRDIHLNELGNRLAAEAIAEWVGKNVGQVLDEPPPAGRPSASASVAPAVAAPSRSAAGVPTLPAREAARQMPAGSGSL